MRLRWLWLSVGAPMYCKGCSENSRKNKMLLCMCKKYSDEYKLVKGIEKRGEECLCGK